MELADLADDVVALAAAGQPLGTGFLLGRTSLLVTDANVFNGFVLAGRRGDDDAIEATLVAGGDPFPATLVLPPDHEQDYALFDASPRHGSGVIGRTDEPSCSVGEEDLAVAVGDRAGLVSGRVTARGVDVNVAGMPGDPGRVDDLTATDIVTQQWSAGAPLLCGDGALLGMVVAGDQ